MTAKQFFKSTAFKCIAVLLSIVLVCGILLTICNSLFYVSAEERLDRAISKIYGEEVTYEIDSVDGDVALTSATVSEVYKITTYEGDYLLKVTGGDGFSGGTVTCWVRVNASAEGAIVKKISIDSNVGQSYISKISGGALDSLVAKQENEDFTSFNTEGIKTGATFSMGAISNAANGARAYVSAKYLGSVSKFDSYQYGGCIDEATTVSVSGTEVTYNIVTTSNGPAQAFEITVKVNVENATPVITYYAITKNGSSPDSYADKMSPEAKNLEGKNLADIEALISPFTASDGYNPDGELKTGATAARSNYLCYMAGAFATANYDKAYGQYAQGGNE